MRGRAAVEEVLATVAPAIALVACLGAGLLMAEAIPVARVLVLGPGSGDTMALAWPIMAYAPAVLGFALMGLATRALFAEHRVRRAGLTTVVAWATVIAGVGIDAVLARPEWVVTGIALASSAGMLVGAVVGWVLVMTGRAGRRNFGLLRTCLRAVPVGAGVGALAAVAGHRLATAGLLESVFGAVVVAVAATVVIGGGFALVDRRGVRTVLALRRRATTADRPT